MVIISRPLIRLFIIEYMQLHKDILCIVFKHYFGPVFGDHRTLFFGYTLRWSRLKAVCKTWAEVIESDQFAEVMFKYMRDFWATFTMTIGPRPEIPISRRGRVKKTIDAPPSE
jgi:hypothetical protein